MTRPARPLVPIAAATLVLAACSASTPVLPADTASADEVVTAYTDALSRGDCRTAKALVHARAQVDPDCGENLHVISRQPSIADPGPWPTWPAGSEVRRVFVQRRADIGAYGGLVRHAETGEWAYWVVRVTKREPWRILGEGLG